MSNIKNMKYFALYVFLLAFSSCSKLNVALKLAPSFVTSNLDDTFDFSSERYNSLKKSIETDIQKNKTEAINEIINGIEQLLVLSEKPALTKADFENNFTNLRILQKKTVQFFKPSISEVLNSLSKKEFEHMKEVVLEKLKKSDDRLLDAEKFNKFALENFEKNLEFLFDEANSQQIKIYSIFIEANYDFYKYQIEVRKDFLKKFELLLDNKAELLSFNIKYYSGDDSTKSPEYIKKQNQFFDNVNQLQLDIWRAATDKQKKSFRSMLNEIKQDLVKLKNETI